MAGCLTVNGFIVNSQVEEPFNRPLAASVGLGAYLGPKQQR